MTNEMPIEIAPVGGYSRALRAGRPPAWTIGAFAPSTGGFNRFKRLKGKRDEHVKPYSSYDR
ncbi:MAG: hypothetical protein ISS50_06525 [Anaerolineae bacterium]|nr:hypothetical protein [Anaerolineae bacterium]